MVRLLLFLLWVMAAPPASAAPWKATRLPEAGGTLALPGPARPPVARPVDLAGRVLPSQTWRYDDEAEGVFLYFIVTPIPEDLLRTRGPGKLLDSARDEAARSLDGRVTEDRPLSVAGLEGREVTFRFAQTYAARLRLLLHDTRLYQLMVVAVQPDASVALVSSILESFRLDAAQRPATETTMREKPEVVEFPLGGFKALWAGKSRTAERGRADVAGREFATRIWSWKDDAAGITYQVVLLTLTADHLRKAGEERILRSVTDDAIRASQGSVGSSSATTLAGKPARELAVQLPEQRRARIRVALIGEQLFLVGASTDRGADLASEDVTRFIESFRLLR